MTPEQQAAYLALAEAKDQPSEEAAVKALEATLGPVDATIDDQKLLTDICVMIRFIMSVADGPPGNYAYEARELLGWQ
jgi:hypothetical protein